VRRPRDRGTSEVFNGHRTRVVLRREPAR
jgi:hypothetical protein